MGDTAGELSHRLELLRLAELMLELPGLRDVLDGAEQPFRLTVRPPLEPRLRSEVADRTVLQDDAALEGGEPLPGEPRPHPRGDARPDPPRGSPPGRIPNRGRCGTDLPAQHPVHLIRPPEGLLANVPLEASDARHPLGLEQPRLARPQRLLHPLPLPDPLLQGENQVCRGLDAALQPADQERHRDDRRRPQGPGRSRSNVNQTSGGATATDQRRLQPAEREPGTHASHRRYTQEQRAHAPTKIEEDGRHARPPRRERPGRCWRFRARRNHQRRRRTAHREESGPVE